MQEALFYIKGNEKKVICTLCPHRCEIKPGKTGICRVRKNIDGMLVSEAYGRVASMAVDPVEKKPLYHFFPGKKILSIGNVGCNLRCDFCQNHEISQCFPDDFQWSKSFTPEQLAHYACRIDNNIGIAYTYNEPFTFYEFMFDTSIRVKEQKGQNVAVTNGFLNENPLKDLLPVIDAFNVDLKGFSDEFYRKLSGGSLQPVLNTLKTIAGSKSHLEITNLVIPGLNDDIHLFKEMIRWIEGELGPGIPLHLSRYFPRYKFRLPPTPAETLRLLQEAASEKLNHVYIGNIAGGTDTSTYCPRCRTLLVKRTNYEVHVVGLSSSGSCSACGFQTSVILS